MMVLLTKFLLCILSQVAVLGECAENIIEIAFEYGRNIGIAFQVLLSTLM